MKRTIAVLLLVGATMLSVTSGFSKEPRSDRQWASKTETTDLTTEQSMDVELDLSIVDLHLAKASGDQAYNVDLRYFSKYFEPLVSYSVRGDNGFLELGMEHDPSITDHADLEDLFKGVGSSSDKGATHNQWNVLLTDRIPLEISADLAMGKGDFDLSGLRVQDLKIDAGFSDVSVKFDTPNPVEMDRLAVEAGLGSFKLEKLGNASARTVSIEVGLGSGTIDLSGPLPKNLSVKMDVGLGSMELLIPRGTQVKIHCDCSFLSSVEFDDFQKKGDSTYLSPGFDESQDYVSLDLSVGLGSATVKWIE